MSKRKKEERGRYTAKRKAEAVMRLLKGEDLDTMSRELGHSIPPGFVKLREVSLVFGVYDLKLATASHDEVGGKV